MLYRLVRPVIRDGSSNRHFQKRIPSDVRQRAVGLRLDVPVGDQRSAVTITESTATIRLSLRTNDPREVRRRHAAVDAYLENVWQALRQDEPVALTHKQAVALAGRLYRAWADEERHTILSLDLEHGRMTPANVVRGHIEPGGWAHDLQRQAAGKTPVEKEVGPLVDRLLMEHGVGRVDAPSREMLLSAFGQALRDGFESRRRNAEGDYSPDPKAERFPALVLPAPTDIAGSAGAPAPIAKGRHSLVALVGAWWKEAEAIGRKPSTHESYRNTMARFVAYLKHDDARRVSKSDVVGFKDYRLASTDPRTGRPISAKTLKDSDLAGLKTIFGWAVANGRLTSNPAEGVTLKIGKRRKLREKWFTDEEAVSLLSAAWKLKQGAERPETFAAKRWVPWLLAYTGARVGEMAQLRKADIRCVGSLWVLKITPEAGTVKTDEVREVILHPHLVELGFPEFVQAADDGHLFLRPAADGDVRGPLRGLKNRLAEFARETVTDRNVAPSHAWRHTFKTLGLEAGIDGRILDAIQGHSPRTEGERYGGTTLQAQGKALAKFPRYKVPGA